MANFQSIIERHGAVAFPEPTGIRIYMQPVTLDHLYGTRSPYATTVHNMIENTPIGVTDLMYLMVDEGHVKTGELQRRRGMHIDGYWIDNNPIMMGHGADRPHTGGGHRSYNDLPNGERRHGGLNHHSPQPDRRWSPLPQHGSGLSAYGPGHLPSPSHGPRHITNEWEAASFDAPEAIILASTHRACRGFIGEFEGPIKDGGDCEHIDISHMHRLSMDPHVAYVGNVTALHESIPVAQDCYHQLVRLNVPGWSPTIQ